MTAFDLAAKLAADAEGFVPHPYLCPAGVWTIGYGSTRDKDGHPVTEETPPVSEADAWGLLERDMKDAFAAVDRCVRVALTDQQRAALADFIYNLGAGAFRGSTLLRLLNAGDYAGAAAEFPKWCHGGGCVLPGLVRRRAAERALFLT